MKKLKLPPVRKERMKVYLIMIVVGILFLYSAVGLYRAISNIQMPDTEKSMNTLKQLRDGFKK